MSVLTAEPARMQALIERLRPLRDQRNSTFDHIAKVAQEHFRVPMALVAVADETEHWFAGRQGMEASCVDKEQAFCTHTVRSDDIFVVEDTLQDRRFADNPLVVGPPHIRFYAGAPLVLPQGLKIGSICILDRQPRGLNVGQRIVLRNLAKVALDEMKAKGHF